MTPSPPSCHYKCYARLTIRLNPFWRSDSWIKQVEGMKLRWPDQSLDGNCWSRLSYPLKRAAGWICSSLDDTSLVITLCGGSGSWANLMPKFPVAGLGSVQQMGWVQYVFWRWVWCSKSASILCCMYLYIFIRARNLFVQFLSKMSRNIFVITQFSKKNLGHSLEAQISSQERHNASPDLWNRIT